MNTPHVKMFVPGVVAATALALSLSAGAQTPAPATAPAAPATGHHMGHSTRAAHHPDMKKECEAMMARHQEMQEKLQEMDATLDKLVAEMNAARDSKAADAMERPMAAVLNELVAQRKASRTLMMDMQHGSMEHMSHHGQMHGTKGAMECPMMKKGDAPVAKGAS
jgi:Skp family chaperone for outer membrane proteins